MSAAAQRLYVPAQLREITFTALNIAVVAFAVSPGSLALFFAICLCFIALRQFAPASLAAAVQIIGITIAVLMLLYYKSSPFLFNATVQGWAARLPGAEHWFAPRILAALGVSYCFLRFIYALSDKAITPWSFVRYYFFFPTFFSGPIISPHEFLVQKLSFSRDNLLRGLTRVLYGCMKFVASSLLSLGIPLATIHHSVLALQTYSTIWLWLTLFLTGFWLYLNFSAFADIAIGTARIFGYRVPENFDRPFHASDLTDFWRRWHITLGNWLRSAIFNPLSRSIAGIVSPQSIGAAVIPILFTMLVCGLWHQTTAPYVIWGTMHGIGLAAQQIWRRYARPALPAKFVASSSYTAASWVITHVYVSLSWVFFFPVDISDYDFHRAYLRRLIGV